jgi:hypothetical protein
VSYWGEIFLGVIALATLTTSIILIVLLIAAARLARRIERLADRVERELTPAFGHLNAIARDAARATSLATAQVELVDRLFADVAQRVEQTLSVFQNVVAGPLRPGGAVAAAFTAFRTALAVIRNARNAHRRRSGRDDEDALFI